jgi:diguanylate cyclase (GGDEF)-like protein
MQPGTWKPLCSPGWKNYRCQRPPGVSDSIRWAALAEASLHDAPLRQAAEPAPASPAHALVYLLEADRTQAKFLAAQLEHFGYRVQSYFTSESLLTALALEQPDVTLLDCDIGLGAQVPPPVIFLSENDDIETRLRAVQAGGEAFLLKPINYGRLVEEIDRVTGRMTVTPYRILIVEDDVSLARYYRALLQDAGMEALAVTQPFEVLRAIAEFNPELILLDVYMPRCTGAELARVIRQHSDHVGLPIVFLSAESDPDVQFAALRVGGDDFLTKPVDPTTLIRAVSLRAGRYRLLGALMVRDALSGLLNHSRIKEMLIAEVTRAKRSNASLAVAMIDLDQFKAINDEHGHMTGDRVIKSLARLLQERLRGSDLAGRYGGEEFLVILPDCELTHASQLIEDIRKHFAQIRQFGAQQEISAGTEFIATFSAGLAAFPLASTPDELIQAADSALHQAKRQLK